MRLTNLLSKKSLLDSLLTNTLFPHENKKAVQGSNQSGTPKTLAASNKELSQPLLANPNGPTRAEPPEAAAGAQPASPKPALEPAAGPSSSSKPAAAGAGGAAAAEEAAGQDKGDHSAAAAPAELSASEFGMARWDTSHQYHTMLGTCPQATFAWCRYEEDVYVITASLSCWKRVQWCVS